MKSTRPRNHRDALVEQEEKRLDLGFGQQITEGSTRLVNQDGTFNVRRIHQSFWSWLNLYNRLITMRWRTFGFVIVATYAVVNTLFAVLYLLFGIDHLQGVDHSSRWTEFYDAFFFSSQTLTTLGYGRIAPVGFWASSVAAVESLLGLLAFALATGLLYGRFSRPEARVRFSRYALISPYLDTTALMFRIVNERTEQLMDATIEATLSLLETLPDGRRTRRYYGLPLERNRIAFFPVNWTLVHPITETSPLWGKTEAELLQSDAEFLVLLRATEDTFSQTVHCRSSYHASEVVWGAKFRKMYDNDTPGVTTLDIAWLSDYERVPLTQGYGL